MGWSISHNMTKAEQVADILKGGERDGNGVRFIKHAVRGNVLYAVGQKFTPEHSDRFEDRFILVCLLRKDRGYGWGYKDMDESMHPYQYDCPLKFLKLAPVASPEWREGVLAHHAKRRAKAAVTSKIKPGTRFRFAPGFTAAGSSLDGDVGVIQSKRARGYNATINGMPIRIQRRHIGEIIE